MAYEVIKITDGAWRIEDGMVRCYLFAGSARALLVDTGMSGGDLASVVRGLTALPVVLVNTHADGDHLGANAQFDEAYMHPAEFSYYYAENPDRQPPARPLWDGDVLDLGGRSFEVIVIPGHTNGSIALLDRANRVIVTGDSVSRVPVFMFGERRNLRAYIYSMNRLLSLSDGFDAVYPSHGEFPVGAEDIHRLVSAAEKLLEGGLEPTEPPYPLPAKMYVSDGVGFYYNA
ncbi:MAG: MBL fold metallo-hydrolase [Oscillospiraceae bacterium]|jgi:glyoxylase-like metal-dependent hydrolase (beta-lactamase superfamily II)|nr:MBL fold metallo-hydrolase [Oscillospiraceae bacterium]